MPATVERQPSRASNAVLSGILIVCVVVVIAIRFSPRLVVWRAWACRPEIFELSETGRARVALWQVEHLGEAIHNQDHRVQRWRLLFPAIAAFLRLPAVPHLALYPTGAILAVGYLTTVLRREGMPPWQTFAALLAITANCWFFTATGWLAYCDGWVAFGLLIVAFSRYWQAVLTISLLLPWADDRFTLGVPMALAVAWVMARGNPPPAGLLLARRLSAAGAGVLVAVSLRVTVAAIAGAEINAAPIPPIAHPDAMLAAGFWHNLRCAWLLIPAALVGLAIRHGSRIATVLAVLAVCCFAVPYAAAYDQSRAAVVLLPLTVVGVFTVAGSARWWPLLPVIGIGNLILPAFHMMLLGFSQIDPLWTELHRLYHPPPRYDPMTYANAAVAQLDKGDPSAAAWLVSIAESLGCEKHVVETIRWRIRLASRAQPTDTPGAGSQQAP